MIDRYHLRATFVLRSTSSIDRRVFQHGNSALHEASWRGYSRTVAALAKALGTQRAPLHARNLAGFAPLHLACQNGHNQSCRELLLAGCNPDLQNNVSNSFDLFPLFPLRLAFFRTYLLLSASRSLLTLTRLQIRSMRLRRVSFRACTKINRRGG